jgi:hypothetical protein
MLTVALATAVQAQPPAEGVWPPPLQGADANGTLTLKDPRVLEVPESVKAAAAQEGAVPFTVAKAVPVIDLAFHTGLPDQALNGTGWSAWGDIGVAPNGKVYSGTGDHGDDAGGKSHAFMYEWDPATKTQKKVVDLNAITERKHGEPTWSKLHARINVGSDGIVYFSGTLNDGNEAGKPQFKWSDAIPAAQLYAYDPATGKTTIAVNLPNARSTATSILDTERMIYWCQLEAGADGNAPWAYDLKNKKEIFRGKDGVTGLNRNIALGTDGTLYFNGQAADGTKGLWKVTLDKLVAEPTGVAFPEGHQMRASTHQAKDGSIYGVTMGPGGGRLFRYNAKSNKLDMLGPDFLKGNYVTVIELSPDEKYLYYLPDAHFHAQMNSTVVQYEIATGQRKVLAFLRNAFEPATDYVPGGTYGIKLSADGSTLYIDLNGHAGDKTRPEKMRASGFGLTSLVAIHIPESER